jgi:hypothetical protein
MRFVSVEYKSGNNKVLGFLRIPDNFPAQWPIGFIEYLKEEKKAVGDIIIYPLNIKVTSDIMGKLPSGCTNMEDDFNLALRSNKYYPQCDTTDAIRRAWSNMDPRSLDYSVKGR